MPIAKSIDTLIPDIQRLFGEGAVLDAAHLDRFSKELAEGFANRFKEYGEERKQYLRMSNLGKPLRQLWFEIKSGLKAEPIPPDAKLKFIYGDVLEDLLLLLAISAGHDVTDIQKKVEVDGVQGSIDCVIDGILVDIKSTSTRSFSKFQDGTLRLDDPFGYVAQLAGYSESLSNLDGAFLAINKELGHICLLKFSGEDLKHYKIRERIKLVREMLSKEEMPHCCCEPVPEGKSGNMKLPVLGSYCGWKKYCYPELRTYTYSNGPVYLTKVVREPKVEEKK